LGFFVGVLAGETVAQPVFELVEVTVVRYCTEIVMISDPPGGQVKSTALGDAVMDPLGPLATLGAVGDSPALQAARITETARVILRKGVAMGPHCWGWKGICLSW
jgi:hypothetical protein